MKYLTSRDDFLFPIESQFNQIFDQFFNGSVKDSLKSKVGYPKMDVSEDYEHLTVKVAVPGIKLEDIDVQLDYSMSKPQLTVSGRTSSYTDTEKVKYYVKELRQSAFTRTLTLPEYAVKEPDAFLEDGILTLRWKVPESNKEPEPKKISIKQIKK